eukprot:4652654-Pyramimonas_sp.AAC.4
MQGARAARAGVGGLRRSREHILFLPTGQVAPLSCEMDIRRGLRPVNVGLCTITSVPERGSRTRSMAAFGFGILRGYGTPQVSPPSAESARKMRDLMEGEAFA